MGRNLNIEVRGYENFKKSLNFYSQHSNWDDIFEEAFETYSDAIRDAAQQNLRESWVNIVTGDLIDSIYVLNDSNSISIWSDHPAATRIEHGSDYSGGVEGRASKDSNIPEYVEHYSDKTLPPGKRMTAASLAFAIRDNQSWRRDVKPFAKPALDEYKHDIANEIVPIARRFQAEGL